MYRGVLRFHKLSRRTDRPPLRQIVVSHDRQAETCPFPIPLPLLLLRIVMILSGGSSFAGSRALRARL